MHPGATKQKERGRRTKSRGRFFSTGGRSTSRLKTIRVAVLQKWGAESSVIAFLFRGKNMLGSMIFYPNYSRRMLASSPLGHRTSAEVQNPNEGMPGKCEGLEE